MAEIAIKSTVLPNVFNQMVNNTGTARLDEFFIQTNEITIDDLYERAFSRKLIINVTAIYGNIVKFQFTSLLT